MRYIEKGQIIPLQILTLGCILSVLCATCTTPEETMQEMLTRTDSYLTPGNVLALIYDAVCVKKHTIKGNTMTLAHACHFKN